MGPSTLLAVLYTTIMNPLQQGVNDDLLVTLSSGQLRGVQRILPNGQIVHSFRGIPYAQPPTGELRFAPPKPSLPWSGVRDATRYGNHCLTERMLIVNAETRMNEDCLFLNVYRPSQVLSSSFAAPLPVMVWIHGGAWRLGQGADYDGSVLASRGQVIVVTLNYRLDALGFLSTEDDVIPGNFGMLDQVMALKWVQQNIRQFGGDPNMVTVFGFSTGGHSVSLLGLSPLATGLFHRLIIESGSSIAPSSIWRSTDIISPRAASTSLGADVGCPQQDSSELLTCLRSVPAEEILRADLEVITNSSIPSTILWKPRVETTNSFLPDEPMTLLSKGNFANVETLHGFCANEMGLIINDTENDGVTETEFNEAIIRALQPYSVDNEVQIAEQAATLFLQGVTSPLQRRSRLEMVLSNFEFTSPVVLQLNTIVRSANSFFIGAPSLRKHFLYRFSYRGDILSRFVPTWAGAIHGMEAPFVFGMVPETAVGWLLGRQPTAEENQLAYQVVEMWSNFARYGDPTPQYPVKSGPWWPEFRSGQYLFLDINPRPYFQALNWTQYDEVFQLMDTRIL